MNQAIRRVMLRHPEFGRCLILNFTLVHLGGAAFIVALPLLIVSNTNIDRDATYGVSLGLFFLLTGIGGALFSSQSLSEEVSGKTWDIQRLTPTSPWSMFLGKLFGSTMAVWLGGIALAFIGIAHGSGKGPHVDATSFLLAALVCFSAQGLTLLLTLAIKKSYVFSRSYQGTPFLATLLISIPFAVTIFSKATSSSDTYWYGLSMEPMQFSLITATLMAAWITYGAYRLMRTELQLLNGPWAWTSFHLFMIVYLGGFIVGNKSAGGDYAEAFVNITALSLGISYVSILHDCFGPVRMRRLLLAIKTKDFHAISYELPLWIPSVIITLTTAALAIAVMALAAEASIKNIILITTLAFMLIRDTGIFGSIGLGFSQAKQLRMIILTTIFMYLILPLATGTSLIFSNNSLSPIFELIIYFIMAVASVYIFLWQILKTMKKGPQAETRSPSL